MGLLRYSCIDGRLVCSVCSEVGQKSVVYSPGAEGVNVRSSETRERQGSSGSCEHWYMMAQDEQHRNDFCTLAA
jgi:hypothetical protein